MKRILGLLALVAVLVITNGCSTVTSAESTVRLTWTAPGNDGNEGMCLLYAIAYHTDSTELVTDFDTYVCDTVMATGPSGTSETHIVEGLSALTQYWFVLKAVDGAGNWSQLSNVPNCVTQDKISPADVANLDAEAL